MTSAPEKIREHLRYGEYREAYLIGNGALQRKDDVPAVVAALRELAAKLRSECMGMAVRKADSGAEYFAKEDLLREINMLTGEDMYGHLLASI